MLTPAVPLRAAIYVRSATITQNDNGDRLEEQAAACLPLAESLGAQVIGEYRDAGFTGTSLERPGLQAMLDAARRHEVDIIVCERPDRLARGVAAPSAVEGELERLGVTVHYVAGDPVGRRAIADALNASEKGR